MDNAILRTKDAAQRVGLSVSTLTKLRVYGGGPAFLKLTTRAVGYRPADLDAWLASRLAPTTSVDSTTETRTPSGRAA